MLSSYHSPTTPALNLTEQGNFEGMARYIISAGLGWSLASGMMDRALDSLWGLWRYCAVHGTECEKRADQPGASLLPMPTSAAAPRRSVTYVSSSATGCSLKGVDGDNEEEAPNAEGGGSGRGYVLRRWWRVKAAWGNKSCMISS